VLVSTTTPFRTLNRLHILASKTLRKDARIRTAPIQTLSTTVNLIPNPKYQNPILRRCSNTAVLPVQQPAVADSADFRLVVPTLQYAENGVDYDSCGCHDDDLHQRRRRQMSPTK